jgi:hypothetical protein
MGKSFLHFDGAWLSADYSEAVARTRPLPGLHFHRRERTESVILNEHFSYVPDNNGKRVRFLQKCN